MTREKPRSVKTHLIKDCPAGVGCKTAQEARSADKEHRPVPYIPARFSSHSNARGYKLPNDIYRAIGPKNSPPPLLATIRSPARPTPGSIDRGTAGVPVFHHRSYRRPGSFQLPLTISWQCILLAVQIYADCQHCLTFPRAKQKPQAQVRPMTLPADGSNQPVMALVARSNRRGQYRRRENRNIRTSFSLFR